MPKENLENDTALENEVDNIGMAHVRKLTSKTEMLPGYGTTNFGVSAYEAKKRFTPANAILASGILSAGFLAVKFRDKITSKVQVLANYALLLREASRTKP